MRIRGTCGGGAAPACWPHWRPGHCTALKHASAACSARPPWHEMHGRRPKGVPACRWQLARTCARVRRGRPGRPRCQPLCWTPPCWHPHLPTNLAASLGPPKQQRRARDGQPLKRRGAQACLSSSKWKASLSQRKAERGCASPTLACCLQEEGGRREGPCGHVAGRRASAAASGQPAPPLQRWLRPPNAWAPLTGGDEGLQHHDERQRQQQAQQGGALKDGGVQAADAHRRHFAHVNRGGTKLAADGHALRQWVGAPASQGWTGAPRPGRGGRAEALAAAPAPRYVAPRTWHTRRVPSRMGAATPAE